MANFQVTWVGDKVREYTTKGGQSYKSCRLAVRDENGNRITKLELSRPADRELPAVGDELQGGIKPHAKFDDLSVFTEGATGEASTTVGGGGSLSSSADTSRDKSIERQVSLKVAGVIVASYAAIGAIKPEQVDEYLAKFTEAGVGAIRGRAESEGKPEEKVEGGTDLDSDIPF